MEAERKDTILYFLTIPVEIALALSTAGLIGVNVAGEIRPAMVFCYILVNLAIYVICRLKDWERFNIPISAAVTLTLALIFRDRELTLNMLVALGVLALICILRLEKVHRFGWVGVSVVSLICWMLTHPLMPRYAAISLVAMLIYALATLLKRDIRYFAGVLVILAVVTLFTPVHDEPCQWKAVRKVVAVVGEAFGNVTGEFGYALEGMGFDDIGGFTGYSGSGKLGGTLTPQTREELYFTKQPGVRRTYSYLKGRSFVTLGPDGFTDPVTEPAEDEWFAMYLNALYHAGVDEKQADCFSEMATANVKYNLLRTEDLIRPMSTLNIYGAGTGAKKKGYIYQVRYLMLDYGSPYLKEILRQGAGEPVPYETLVAYTNKIYHTDLTLLISKEAYEAMVANENHTMELDTSMATDRMRALTEEITAGCETDYDKAVAIEAYLRQYEYSRDVDLSKSENYVDDFLFDTQKGYCVHFASAMVLMLRIAGVPSRYTLGYNHNELRSTSVLGAEAHAWPEAYIEGYGWVPFEPTGAFRSSDDYTWGLVDESVDEDSTQTVEVLNPEDEIWETIDPDTTEEVVAIPGKDPQEEEGWKAHLPVIKKFAGYLGAMCGALLLMFLGFLMGRKIRYMLLSPEEKLRENMKRIYGYLEAQKDKTDESADARLQSLIDEYRKVRFRGDAATEAVVRESEVMMRLVRKKNYREGRTVQEQGV